MLPLLPFHTLAAKRGDGLKPELLALLLRQVPQESGLIASIEADDGDRSADIPTAAATHDSPVQTGEK